MTRTDLLNDIETQQKKLGRHPTHAAASRRKHLHTDYLCEATDDVLAAFYQHLLGVERRGIDEEAVERALTDISLSDKDIDRILKRVRKGAK